MAKTYKTPGTYVEEVSKFPPSVTQVETALPVFIGYTEKAGTDSEPLSSGVINEVTVATPKRISSLWEYENYFGRAPFEKFDVTIEESYEKGTTTIKEQVIHALVPAPSIQTMYYHMQLYFANGGGPCYIISVGDTSGQGVSKSNLLAGLEMARRYEEPTLLVLPQAAHLDTAFDAYEVYNNALLQAGELGNRFVVIDCHGDDPDALRSQSGIGTPFLRYGAAYHPYLCTSLNYLYDLNITENLSITLKGNLGEADVFDAEVGLTPTYSELNAELQASIKVELDKLRVTLPPSAAVVGAYAAVDRSRGVWKAPASISLQLVSGLTHQLTEKEQSKLNIDVDTGKSINAIREFTGKGIMIWGARTLAGNDNEWRYISVRRFFNMVEESSRKATEKFEYEANDLDTWRRVQNMLENFLIILWRQGALQGVKPEHAFYVAVGLHRTMTPLDVLEGRMVVEIGMAVVRPAEFIILRFSQKMSQRQA